MSMPSWSTGIPMLSPSRTPEHPSVVEVLRGDGGGMSLMLNGHINTVSIQSYPPSLGPISGQRQESHDDGRVLWQGVVFDLNAGVAAAADTMPGSPKRITVREPYVYFLSHASAVENDHPIEEAFGHDAPSPSAKAFWCDTGLLNAASICTIVSGPGSFGICAEEDWVSIRVIQEVISVLEAAARQFRA
ncbi:hypothetical protein BKA66DRAFT_447870 [Pyrenochaeta sp. MPI-SDFR-AT-0127]|nr:hypothetical protein BKA66DRAFT_447870 [Pyrenochaeta sp. MPI-SDFR-AT-0127]